MKIPYNKPPLVFKINIRILHVTDRTSCTNIALQIFTSVCGDISIHYLGPAHEKTPRQAKRNYKLAASPEKETRSTSDAPSFEMSFPSQHFRLIELGRVWCTTPVKDFVWKQEGRRARRNCSSEIISVTNSRKKSCWFFDFESWDFVVLFVTIPIAFQLLNLYLNSFSGKWYL